MIPLIPNLFPVNRKGTTRTQQKWPNSRRAWGEGRIASRNGQKHPNQFHREEQRLAAGRHVHLLRDRFQRHRTRWESARRTAAAFIRTQRYKLSASFLSALTGNERVAPLPTSPPDPAPALPNPEGEGTRAGRRSLASALAPFHRSPPAPPHPVLGRTKPSCPRSVACEHPKHTCKCDHHLRDPKSSGCVAPGAGPLPFRSPSPPNPNTAELQRSRAQVKGLSPAAYLPPRGLPRSADAAGPDDPGADSSGEGEHPGSLGAGGPTDRAPGEARERRCPNPGPRPPAGERGCPPTPRRRKTGVR